MLHLGESFVLVSSLKTEPSCSNAIETQRIHNESIYSVVLSLSHFIFLRALSLSLSLLSLSVSLSLSLLRMIESSVSCDHNDLDLGFRGLIE